MKKSFGWVAVPIVLAASALCAQEPARELRPATAPGAAAPTAQLSRADQEIAAVKLAFCRNEVELGKLASQKAQSEEVRQFAAQMVKEHTAGCAKLEKFAGTLATTPGATTPGVTAPGIDNRPARPSGGVGAEVRVQPGAGAAVDVGVRQAGTLNWVAIHQQMADQCLATSKQELSKKDGAEFDKCYMGMAIGGHHQAVVADQVLQNYASPQFRGELEACLKTATDHLNEAKQIMEKLAGNAPRATARPQ